MKTLNPRNRILAGLSDAELDRMSKHLELVELAPRDLLYDVNTPIEHVYFIESGVGSVIGVMADGSAVEVATIGPEGMVGLPVFHGAGQTTSQAFCQVAGEALRMPVPQFREEVARNQGLAVMLHRYSQALFTLVAQSSACNRIHSMRERCARWLLHTHDRVGGDEFGLTHQFLSQMLGVRRATVTEALGTLQESGAIRYRAGIVQIEDRARLEHSACECYGIIRAEFDRLLGPALQTRAVRSPLEGVKTSEAGQSTAGDAVPT